MNGYWGRFSALPLDKREGSNKKNPASKLHSEKDVGWLWVTSERVWEEAGLPGEWGVSGTLSLDGKDWCGKESFIRSQRATLRRTQSKMEVPVQSQSMMASQNATLPNPHHPRQPPPTPTKPRAKKGHSETFKK